MTETATISLELDEAPPLDVLDEIGRGGTAVVERVRLGVDVGPLRAGALAARKRALASTGAKVLEREARVASAVAHPRLVRLAAWWRGADGPELLLELLPGETLDRLVAEEGALPEPLVRRAGTDLAGALAALHAGGYAHGDPSLANARADESGRAVLLDLGNAYRFGDGEGSATAGTLAYFAPERLRGGPPSPAADVFGLGVLLYSAATGRHPFAPQALAIGASPPELDSPAGEALLSALELARYVPPSRVAPHVSPLLDVLLAEMLDRRAQHRPTAAVVEGVLARGEDDAWWRERSAVLHAAPSTDLALDPLVLPLVGRDEQLAALDRAYRHCVDPDSGGSVVLVRGRKGTGRSRLVHHFVDRVRREADAPLFLYARASEEAESRPHGAALRLLERWLVLEPPARPSEYERELLARTVPPRETDVLMSALDTKSSGLLGGSVGRALVRWVQALVAQQRTILFVDDLHAARSSTLATAERLVEALADTRAMIVFGVGDEVAPARPRSLGRLVARVADGGPGHFVVQLDPLDERGVRDVVEQRFGGSTDVPRLARILWERSQGLPGLLTEMLRTLFERGQLVDAPGGGWELTIAPERIPHPRSVGEGVADRLAALESRGRQWLERFSVLDGRIDPDTAFETFRSGRRSDLDKALTLLVRRGWIAPVGNHYVFTSPALREGVYAALDEDRRRRLHRLAAKRLDVAEPTLEQRFARVWHLRAAAEHRTLVAELTRLLPIAQTSASPMRVLRLAHWATEALEALPDSSQRDERLLEFLEVGADAAGRTGARGSERRFLERLAAVQPDSARRPDAAARLYYLHGRALADTGQIGVARGLLRAAVTASERAGSRALLGRSLRLLAMVQLRSGRTDLAQEAAARALEQAERPFERGACAVLLGSADLLEDRIEDATAHVADAQRALKEEERPPLWLVPHVGLLRAKVLRAGGRSARALAALHLALEDARQATDRPLEAEILARIANLEMEAGDFATAERHLASAREIAEETESSYPLALASVWLGMLAWEREDAGALERLSESVEVARSAGHYRAEAVARSLLARCRAFAGEEERAVAESDRATAILARHGAELFDRLVVVGSRALVLARVGRKAEAEALQRELDERVDRPNPPIADEALATSRRDYARRLLEGLRSEEGPIFPRFER